MNPIPPEPPDPAIPGHPDGVPIKQPTPDSEDSDAASTSAVSADLAGGAIEGAGCCLEGCAGCSLAVLVALSTAGAAVAAWLG